MNQKYFLLFFLKKRNRISSGVFYFFTFFRYLLTIFSVFYNLKCIVSLKSSEEFLLFALFLNLDYTYHLSTQLNKSFGKFFLSLNSYCCCLCKAGTSSGHARNMDATEMIWAWGGGKSQNSQFTCSGSGRKLGLFG